MKLEGLDGRIYVVPNLTKLDKNASKLQCLSYMEFSSLRLSSFLMRNATQKKYQYFNM